MHISDILSENSIALKSLYKEKAKIARNKTNPSACALYPTPKTATNGAISNEPPNGSVYAYAIVLSNKPFPVIIASAHKIVSVKSESNSTFSPNAI